MSLSKGCTPKALRKNIRAEMRAGKPQRQAVAIAFSTQRKACCASCALEALRKKRRAKRL